LPSTRPSVSIAPTPKRKKAKRLATSFQAYLSEETMSELWSTGSFEQGGGDDQQLSAEFKKAFGMDDNENAALEGRTFAGIVIPDIGLPAE
jgi:hypothetical protein